MTSRETDPLAELEMTKDDYAEMWEQCRDAQGRDWSEIISAAREVARFPSYGDRSPRGKAIHRLREAFGLEAHYTPAGQQEEADD